MRAKLPQNRELLRSGPFFFFFFGARLPLRRPVAGRGRAPPRRVRQPPLPGAEPALRMRSARRPRRAPPSAIACGRSRAPAARPAGRRGGQVPAAAPRRGIGGHGGPPRAVRGGRRGKAATAGRSGRSRVQFLGAGPRRLKLPRRAKIYMDKCSDPGDGGAERHGRAATRLPRGEVHGKVVRGAGRGGGEVARRGGRAGRVRRGGGGGTRELARIVRREIDAAGGGSSRERMRVRRKAEAHPGPRSHQVVHPRRGRG